MKPITFLVITQIMLICGCGNDPGNHSKFESSVYFSNDAEVRANFWINEQNIIRTDTNAHSGKHVSLTDSSRSFSLGFRKTLGLISGKELRSVVISAWVCADSLIQPFKGLSLVASANDEDSKNIFFGTISIDNDIKESKKWLYVSGEVPMRFDQDATNLFTGYVLNNSKTKVLVDDISFRFIEK